VCERYSVLSQITEMAFGTKVCKKMCNCLSHIIVFREQCPLTLLGHSIKPLHEVHNKGSGTDDCDIVATVDEEERHRRARECGMAYLRH